MGSSSVLLKLEGSLPSGSFKDRGTAVLFGSLVVLTSALPVAALDALHASGEIDSDDKVVIALTGHGLKSAGQLGDRLGVV